MATWTIENQIEVAAPVAVVWERVVHPDGINHEMRPWMTMSMPRGAAGLTVDTVELGEPVGRAWLRLFGLVPFDFDHLTVAEVDPGTRFLERSTMLSMRTREHERTLTPVADGTVVHDRVTFRPRLPVPGLASILALVVDAFFQHRQRRNCGGTSRLRRAHAEWLGMDETPTWWSGTNSLRPCSHSCSAPSSSWSSTSSFAWP